MARTMLIATAAAVLAVVVYRAVHVADDPPRRMYPQGTHGDIGWTR